MPRPYQTAIAAIDEVTQGGFESVQPRSRAVVINARWKGIVPPER